MFQLYCIIYFACFVGANQVENRMSSEISIRTLILAGYDKTLPPSIFSTEAYSNMLMLYRVQGLNEKRGEFKAEALVIIIWRDDRFQWDNSDLEYIRVPSENVWLPHLYVFNSIQPYDVTMNSLVYAYKTTLIWFRRAVFHTSCVPNMKYYPFDTQVCSIRMSVGSKEGDALPSSFGASNSTTLSILIRRYFIQNPQWALRSMNIKKRKLLVNGVKRDVGVFRFTIKRSMPLISVGLLTPSITCLILLLCTFWMEAGSNVRAALSATSTLVSTSSMFSLSKILPCHGSDTPIIVEYVAVTTILSAAASCQTFLVSILSRYERPPPISYATLMSKLPLWLQRVIGNLNELPTIYNSYLFSDLSVTEITNSVEAEGFADEFVPRSPASEATPTRLASERRNLWKNHIALFDRITFFVVGLVITLFVISVIVTE